MNRAARNVLRKIGTDVHLEEEREEHVAREMDEARSRGQQAEEEARKRPGQDEGGMSNVPEELLTESEKRHELYRRRQSMASRTESAAERLPIMTSEERKARDRNRPKYHATEFEGPIEKLIEKYQDLDEVHGYEDNCSARNCEHKQDDHQGSVWSWPCNHKDDIHTHRHDI